MDEHHVVELDAKINRCLVTGDPCGISSFSTSELLKEDAFCKCENCRQWDARMVQFLELEKTNNGGN